MLELANEQIAMGQKAADKAEALRLLADRLVADGLVADGYLQGLQAREAQGSTFLGQGIAIPHGRSPSLTQLRGLFVRMEKPIDFEALDGQPVDLIFVLIAPEGAGAGAGGDTGQAGRLLLGLGRDRGYLG